MLLFLFFFGKLHPHSPPHEICPHIHIKYNPPPQVSRTVAAKTRRSLMHRTFRDLQAQKAYNDHVHGVAAKAVSTLRSRHLAVAFRVGGYVILDKSAHRASILVLKSIFLGFFRELSRFWNRKWNSRLDRVAVSAPYYQFISHCTLHFLTPPPPHNRHGEKTPSYHAK